VRKKHGQERRGLHAIVMEKLLLHAVGEVPLAVPLRHGQMKPEELVVAQRCAVVEMTVRHELMTPVASKK